MVTVFDKYRSKIRVGNRFGGEIMADRNLALAASVAAGALVISSCTIAVAGDLSLPRHSPPPPIYPVSPWTGFYIGGHFGGAATSDSIEFWGGGGPDNGPIHPSGKIGGLQAGYNWQMLPHWLIGIEEELSFTSVNGSQDSGFWNIKHNWYDTLDARLGYVLPVGWGNLLVYAKGGAAWMNGDYYGGDIVPGGNPGTYSLTRSGWNIGAGVEYLLAPHWSVKAEYAFLNFQKEQIPSTAVWASENHINEFKVGVNYHFTPGILFGRW
jgi:opacity protein-like surface antigen